jgi:hypothetical protein
MINRFLTCWIKIDNNKNITTNNWLRKIWTFVKLIGMIYTTIILWIQLINDKLIITLIFYADKAYQSIHCKIDRKHCPTVWTEHQKFIDLFLSKEWWNKEKWIQKESNPRPPMFSLCVTLSYVSIWIFHEKWLYQYYDERLIEVMQLSTNVLRWQNDLNQLFPTVTFNKAVKHSRLNIFRKSFRFVSVWFVGLDWTDVNWTESDWIKLDQQDDYMASFNFIGCHLSCFDLKGWSWILCSLTWICLKLNYCCWICLNLCT